ncbi:MAG: RNA-guided endonuclease TnpB family protein [Candidatus Thorarchaeota archaeon]
MLIARAFKYELDPNNQQRTKLSQNAGCARFAYNWGLQQRIALYRQNQDKDRYTSAIAQHRELNRLKRTDFPWMYETSKCAPQEALRDLERAFRNFYRGLKSGKRVGFPRFKKRGVHDSFRLTGTIRFVGRLIQLPRLGRIRLKEKREGYFKGRILSATVIRRADRWYVSVTIEMELDSHEPPGGGPVGVDLGVKTLATLSDGTSYSNPRALEKKLRKLRRLSKSLSRKKRGSKNRERARLGLARLHLRVFNIRQDTLHKITTYLAKNHSQIVIEDLCVSGLLKNRKLSRVIADVGFYEFRRQLEYKCEWYGSELVVAPRFYPSSKRCSICGNIKKDLTLSDRVYVCAECGLEMDRDLNAACNLVAASWTETKNACGEDVRLVADSVESAEQTSMNQEPNISQGY